MYTWYDVMVGIYFKDRTMAQELEQILELLREIRRANTTNDESFKRLLNSMNGKIDTLDKNAAFVSADLENAGSDTVETATATNGRMTASFLFFAAFSLPCRSSSCFSYSARREGASRY